MVEAKRVAALIDEVEAEAPPLTEEQAKQIALLLLGGRGVPTET